MMRPITWLGLTLLALSGCRAEVIDHCLDDPSDCPPCEGDDDCFFAGNACYETVLCTARGSEVAFPDLGCSEALEHAWPDDDQCRCDEASDHICRWTGRW